jgi:hypothetical protein
MQTGLSIKNQPGYILSKTCSDIIKNKKRLSVSKTIGVVADIVRLK